jgi:hypothetical protein
MKLGIRWTGYVALLVEINTQNFGQKPEGWGSFPGADGITVLK